MTLSDYETFIQSKRLRAQASGFVVSAKTINPLLFDWQREIVAWALRLGKAALFAECGLGKTAMQAEWSARVAAHTGGKVLILAPLAVAHQTVREGAKFGIAIRYCRSQEEANAATEQVIVANYDMLKAFDPARFSGVVLDESSILKAYTGATKRAILEAFARAPYKLACTATPAPNDHLELGNHAQFLDIMASNEMISRWFINDTMAAGNYRLKRHAEKDFWRWVATWAVCVSKPSDLGYADDGFVLPPLELHEHIVEVDQSRAHADGRLIVDANLSATAMWREKAATARDRAQRAAELVATNNSEPWIVWCDTNEEADLLLDLLPASETVEVRGSHSVKVKETRLQAFSDGAARLIVTKPDIAGFGLNWQHCANQVFVGVTYSFEKTYQALRRSYRFGQSRPVHAHLIYAESEGNILDTLKTKQEAHTAMQDNMNEAMRAYGLSAATDHRPGATPDHQIATGDNWTMHLGDCVTVSRTLPSDSMDFLIFSPPFSNLYIYSDSEADMGNAADHEEFFRHYDFLAPELFRLTRPGRLCAIHCKDLPLYMNRDGAAGLYDFPGDIRASMERAGWVYHSRVTIWKDPVIEMQRTKNHGLLHKNFSQRAEVTRQGMADYLLVFRKWVDDMPDGQVKQRREPGDYIGTRPPTHFNDNRDYSIQVWQRYASPVWFDIDQTNVLNFQMARDNDDEKHICPLQLDVIERCVDLWTNEGETVFSPFAGIGSEGYAALKRRRQFVGVELKESYWQHAQRYLAQAAMEAGQRTLFDLLEAAS